MKYRRRQRWLRRLALGFAFATVVAGGKVSPAWAKFDEGGAGKTVVVTGGWSGAVDPDSGIPMGAGIPTGDEPFVSGARVRAAEAIHDPSLAYASQGILGEALESRQATQASATRPDDRGDRFTSLAQPPVISYLSHGLGSDGEVGARPDNRSDRFAHSDVAQRVELASGSGLDWNDAYTFGIGAMVLVLALGLGFGYVRRPRLAL